MSLRLPVRVEALGKFHEAKALALLGHPVLGHMAVIDSSILLKVRLQASNVLEALQGDAQPSLACRAPKTQMPI